MLSSVRRHTLFPLRQICRLFSSSAGSAAPGGIVSPDVNFMVEYLVNSCAFSAAAASKASKSLAHLQSTEKPDAVVAFLRSHGIDGANLRKILSSRPRFLCWDVEKNLSPKFRFFHEMGLSQCDLVNILVANPGIMCYNIERTLHPRLKMWESLFGSRERLLKHLKNKRWFFGNSAEKVVRPNIKYLVDECGIPEERVSLVVKLNPNFITQSPGSLRALITRAEELGVPRQSGMYLWALHILHMVSKEKVQSQIKLMKRLGWLDSEFSTAIRKQPNFIGISQEVLQRKMDFFVKEVGLTPSYIAHQPALLLLSLEKRVIPRFRVIEMLKSKGLWTGQHNLLSIFIMSTAKFMDKIVLRYKEVPELLEIFLALNERKERL